MDLADLGDAEPRNLHHVDEARRGFLPQVVEQGGSTRGEHFDSDLESGRPDATQLGELAARSRLCEIVGEAGYRPSRGLIRPYAECVFSLEFEIGRNLLEHSGDFVLAAHRYMIVKLLSSRFEREAGQVQQLPI